MKTVSVLYLAYLFVCCKGASNSSINNCSIDEAKRLAVADFLKHRRESNYQINAAKDTIGCYYFSIGVKNKTYRKEGEWNILYVGGGRHYYFEKKSCKLLRVEIDQ